MDRFAVALFLVLGLAAPGLAQDASVRLDSVVQAAERRGFSGVVRVQQAGRILLAKGYGLANREAKIPFGPGTVVQIGSNTKDFTAVAILQLHEAGRLSMADTLGKHFPGAPADKRGITIRQLMNHRAGFPHALGGDFEPLGRSALVDRAMAATLHFAPGTREGYSNTGFSLLAAVIEQVTGETYDVHIRKAILAPLGLKRTGFLLPGFAPTDLAHGYGAAGTDNGTMLGKAHAADGPYWNLRGNGGMLSTAADMQAFYSALFETEKLMTRQTRALRFNPDERGGFAGSDGINFFIYERYPGMRTEVIIASTNAAAKAPAILRELGKVLGLPADDDVAERGAPRPGAAPATGAMVQLLRQLVAAINSGDRAVLRAFITDHFTSGQGAPTVDERLERIGRMNENLGTITVESIEAFPSGPVEMRVKSSLQGTGLIRVDLSDGSPLRIRALRVMIGG